MSNTIRVNSINKESMVDGEGLRYVIYLQGCKHNCFNCHNPETHNFTDGKDIEIEELIEKIKENPLLDGVTLSGGDPFFQAERVIPLIKEIKKLGLNVWAYTGYTWEQFLEFRNNKDKDKKHMIKMLSLVDVLVDGRYEDNLRSYLCTYRGSSNQRLIDVNKSKWKKEPKLLKIDEQE